MSVIKETENYILKNDFEIEIESLQIVHHNCWIYYDQSKDQISIVCWNDWHGDIEFLIDTSKFESFAQTRNLEFSKDQWDYANESVYQKTSKMDLDEYVLEYGYADLIDHVKEQIEINGIIKIKRPFMQRVNRNFQKIRWEIKNFFNKLKRL